MEYLNSKVYQYLDLKFFRFFRDRLNIPDLYFSTDKVAQKRKAMLTGYQLPLTCFWRATDPKLESKNYGRGVVYREFMLDDRVVACRIPDLTIEYNLYSESYYLDYVSYQSQKLLLFNMDRYFRMDFTDLISDYSTTVEFAMKDDNLSYEEDEDTNPRRFYINVGFTVTVTIPFVEDTTYVDTINVYLNGNPVSTLPSTNI